VNRTGSLNKALSFDLVKRGSTKRN